MNQHSGIFVRHLVRPVVAARWGWLCRVGILVATGGCASTGTPPASEDVRSLADAGRPSGSVPLLEMEITNRAFVEWYVSLVGQATEDVLEGNVDQKARREASLFRFMQGSSAYAIVSGPNPYAQLIDLVALITLARLQWIEEGLAQRAFGERATSLESAIEDAHERVWERADRYMTVDEVAHLNEVIREWRARNPDLRSLSFVRITDFAHELAVAMDTFREDRGIFGRIAETNREIDEARLLGERALFLFERSPVLLGWRVDAIVSDMMTHPDLARAGLDLAEISGAAAEVDARLARLEALFAELPSELAGSLFDGTELQQALRAVVGIAPGFEELPASAAGVESALARIVTLIDEVEAIYTPSYLQAQADLAAARVASEARGLILLAAACGAALILLYFGLGVILRRPDSRAR